MEIGLAPYPWLLIFRPDGAFAQSLQNLLLNTNSTMKHLWGGGNFTGPAWPARGRIKISCLFWLLFVVRQKVTQGNNTNHLIIGVEELK
jgi:hypothetical protein